MKWDKIKILKRQLRRAINFFRKTIPKDTLIKLYKSTKKKI